MPHICIHGHFYQPPREDPWTGVIGIQPSAAPFPDWNRRISSECYAPNLHARVMDEDGEVIERINTWSHIAFDVGPTLMRWLLDHEPAVHAGIIAADRHAVQLRGQGNAIAQGYHHAILPLCSPEDQQTEILWGLRDFQARFGRPSRGIWLPETAADEATLCAVADAGVEFVLLSPEQADDDEVDTTRAWSIPLPGDRQLAAFFYDAEASRGVAFDSWLDDGVEMARRLSKGRGLVHIATDGESYGHHHRHGEMALASLIRTLRADGVTMTNHACWLDAHPPKAEMRLRLPSSWSCTHGVGRWSRDCGCGTEEGGGEWRAALRGALDSLRDRIDAWCIPELLERTGEDPWALRNQYIDVLLRGEGFDRPDPLAGRDPQVRALLEIQRHRLMMFTSCGWFFGVAGGLEPTQILRYARRACEEVVKAGGPELWQETRLSLQGFGFRP